ncbi:daunorubicin resistance protein DrrA family ABC transporter ATP-binding protein [Halalkalibacter hemicellulosilyticus]|uniref:Multidrug ABC transporter ATP-binding protein n=1 Tax=Halalkalibacter hemicellulosilyticusJCM 9152 TaxID=1236971 RepID=W4Q9P1_9BACI|nr:daunorubicin resistance protein DrrA family ABC transporter ATP-binding protein [Halalkalibacter hemicellulosilyticus]GAE28720.1 multidrug ABC transporter ATP-binding protein [Halalkalibacter hemicellulosilyticusJCM 9152]
MSMEHKEEWAINAKGLVKTFGQTRAVNGVDLQVKKGTIYGVLGPNGAGKTTTVRMLATLLKPDGGHAEVMGHDLVKEAVDVRSKVSMTGQFASVDEELSGLENLILIARLIGYSWREAKARAKELLKAYDLEEAALRQVGKYSGGMRRRIDIAASTIISPDVLFLDEPTTGLDPRSRNQVWEVVKMLANAGTTVLLTTQYLEEADQLADRIAVIEDGKVIAEGTSSELKASVGSGVFSIRLVHSEDRSRAEQLLATKFHTNVQLSTDSKLLSVHLLDTEQASGVLKVLEAEEIELADFSFGQPSLDEVFLALTGKQHDKGGEEAS